MKVVLLQDVKAQGKKGELVTVSDGYARNYLFPRNLATPADAKAMSELKNRESSKQYHAEMALKEAKEAAAKVEGKEIRIAAKAGSAGKLFGAVTSKRVAEELKTVFGIGVEKKFVQMDDIKQFGTFPVKVKFHQEVSATLNVTVAEE